MKPLDATLRAGSAVAALVSLGAVSGCYYYVPYGYYPYGSYPANAVVSTAATQQEVSSVAAGGPGGEQQSDGEIQFAMPDGTPSADAAPAYYPVAYPYPYYYPSPYYAYDWPGFWWPSASFSVVFFGGCCGHFHGHPHHFGHWGHDGNWGGGHGSWGPMHASSNGGGWGGAHGWSGGGGHFWGAGGGHGR